MSVLVVLANGFEEIEALTVVDLLRRAELEVVTVGVEGEMITGSHDITVKADRQLADLDDGADFNMIVLPGGMPGSKTLREHERVQALVKAMAGAGRFVAAICAAPMALAEAGLLRDKKVTCFPGALADFPACVSSGAPVERDGRLITARGPGVATEFALALIEALAGQERSDQVNSRLQRVG